MARECTLVLLTGVCPDNPVYEQLKREWLGIPELSMSGGFDHCGCSVGCWALDDADFVNGGNSQPYPMSGYGTRWLRPMPGSMTNRLANGEESPIESLKTNEIGRLIHPVYRVPQAMELQRAAVHQSFGRECFDESTCEAWPPVCSTTSSVTGDTCGESLTHCVDQRGGGSTPLYSKLGGKWADVFFAEDRNLANPWCRLGNDPSGPKTVSFSSTDVLAKPIFFRSYDDAPASSTPAAHSVNALIPCISKVFASSCGMSAYNMNPLYRGGWYSGNNIAGVFHQWGMRTSGSSTENVPIVMPHFLLGDEAERLMKNEVLKYAFREDGLSVTGGPATVMDRVDKSTGENDPLDMWSRRWEPRPVELPVDEQVYDETVEHSPVEVGQPRSYAFTAPPGIYRLVDGELELVDDSIALTINIVAKLSTYTTFSVLLNGTGAGVSITDAVGPDCDGGFAFLPMQITMAVGRWRELVQPGEDAVFTITPLTGGGEGCPNGGSLAVTLTWPTPVTGTADIPADTLPVASTFEGRLARSGHALIIEARLHYVQLDLSLIAELYDARASPDPFAHDSQMRLRPHIRVEMHCRVVYTARLAEPDPDGPEITNPVLGFSQRPTVEGDTILYSVDGHDMRLPPPTRFSWWGWTGRLENSGNRWGANVPGNLGCCNIQKQLHGTLIYGWPTHVESHPSSDDEPYNPNRTYGGQIMLTRFRSWGICDTP